MIKFLFDLVRALLALLALLVPFLAITKLFGCW